MSSRPQLDTITAKSIVLQPNHGFKVGAHLSVFLVVAVCIFYAVSAMNPQKNSVMKNTKNDAETAKF